MWDFMFFFNSILLGIGLAMDAFSVSLANGLHEPTMRRRKLLAVAGTFSVFQFLMPMLGFICVHTFVECFCAVEPFIPWVALALLLFIGGKMMWEGIRGQEECDTPKVGFVGLMVQGVATSIDALSVGFTIADHTWPQALVACLLIGVVTFGICAAGVLIGRKFGTAFSGKASILGGAILMIIGVEIFLTGVL